MKQIFHGYYRPSTQDFSTLWKNCLFVLDANVLLNLYRYPKNASHDLIQVFSRIADRLWIPHQVAFEYQVNRLSVLAEQISRYDDVRKVLSSTSNYLQNGLAPLQLKKRHSAINPDDLLSKVDSLFHEFTQKLDELEKGQPDVFEEDKIREEIDRLFERRVGQPPSQQDLDNIYQDGKVRYAQECPPGYKDLSKAKQGEKELSLPPYIYKNLVIKREYGDLLVWFQIIQEAKKRELQYLIFVTDDEKEDWWWIVESKGKKNIGPRPELVEEIMLKTQVTSFYMYNSERFMEYAKEYLGVQIEEESIRQVRDIAQLRGEIPSSSSCWM